MSRLFPPRQTQPTRTWHNKGRQKSSFLTINGRVEVCRTVYWNKHHGVVIPLDTALGSGRYSVGVQEICCQVSGSVSFRRAAEDMARTAQLSIGNEAVRLIGGQCPAEALEAMRQGQLVTDWTRGVWRMDSQ